MSSLATHIHKNNQKPTQLFEAAQRAVPGVDPFTSESEFYETGNNCLDGKYIGLW